jgi:hypothetical protein
MTQVADIAAADRYFRTDHLLGDLKARSMRGGAVTLSAQAVKFVLQLGSTAVLARLLTPADFGLVAMVAAFTGFISLFKDLGLSMATVQRVEITQAQVSTLFWINVALSVLLMVIAAALAPAVAWFYGDQRLTGIMLVCCSNVHSRRTYRSAHRFTAPPNALHRAGRHRSSRNDRRLLHRPTGRMARVRVLGSCRDERYQCSGHGGVVLDAFWLAAEQTRSR